MQPNLSNRTTIIVSLFVSCVLFLQFMVIPTKVINKPMAGKYWPIIDYPMYTKAHYEGDYINVHYPLHVTFADGQVEIYGPEKMNLGLWHYQHVISRLKWKSGKYLPEVVPLILEMIGPSREVVKLDVYTYPLIIGKNGAETAPGKLLKSVDVQALYARGLE